MNVRAILVSCCLLAAVAAPARAAVSPQLAGLAGTWSCATKGFGPTTIVATPWGNWIKEEISFPAMGSDAASSGTAFIGWDPQQKKWIYSEVDQVGTYFVSKSESAGYADSTWSSTYPTQGDVTIIKMSSPNQYTVDSQFTENGKKMSFHQDCTRK